MNIQRMPKQFKAENTIFPRYFVSQTESFNNLSLPVFLGFQRDLEQLLNEFGLELHSFSLYKEIQPLELLDNVSFIADSYFYSLHLSNDELFFLEKITELSYTETFLFSSEQDLFSFTYEFYPDEHQKALSFLQQYVANEAIKDKYYFPCLFNSELSPVDYIELTQDIDQIIQSFLPPIIDKITFVLRTLYRQIKRKLSDFFNITLNNHIQISTPQVT